MAHAHPAGPHAAAVVDAGPSTPDVGVVARGDEPGPPRGQGARRRRLRSATAALLVIAACLASIAAVTAAWARYTVLDTDRFTSVVGPLASDPAVQSAVSRELTRELSALVDERALFERALPVQGQILADPLAVAVDRFLADQVDNFVGSDRFAALWNRAVRVAHERAVAILRGDIDNASLQTRGDEVVLDLRPLLAVVVERVGDRVPALFDHFDASSLTSSDRPAAQRLSDALDVELSPDFGTVPVFSTQKLETAQTALRRFDRLTALLVILAVVLSAAAVAVSSRRRRTVLVLGVGLAIGMVVARRVTMRLENDVVHLVTDPVNRNATDATVRHVLSPFLDLLAFLALGAAAIALVAFVTGPSRPAAWLRRKARPGVVWVRSASSAARTEASGRISANAWLADHRDVVRLAVAALAVILLLAVDLSWIGLFVLLGVVTLVELVLAGVPAPASIAHGDAG